jgi:hypothetical protein
MAVTKQGIILSLGHGTSSRDCIARLLPGEIPSPATEQRSLRMSLIQPNAHARLRAEQKQESVSNYFIGNDRARWRSNVENYAAVRAAEVYPGIDWVLYGNQRQLEYDFRVAPYANPKKIKLRIEGAEHLSVDADGDLLVGVGNRTLRQLKPAIYQIAADGEKQKIEGGYRLERHRVSFAVGAYDASRELIIDPLFVYSTYLGGSSSDGANAIAVDTAGNAYVAGFAGSTDFPTVNPIQESVGGGSTEAFVAKFNASGSALVYSTYLGGSHYNVAGSIAIDSDGDAYIAGFTESSDFPTVNGFQGSKQGEGAAFVSKLNPAGNALIYSTYLGGSDAAVKLGGAGSGSTQAYGIAVDGGSSPAECSNPPPATICGEIGDTASAIAADGAGNIYVAGAGGSTDFPILAPYQDTNRAAATYGSNAFVTKIMVAPAGAAGSGGSGGGGAMDWSLIGALGLGIVVRCRRRFELAGKMCESASANFFG